MHMLRTDTFLWGDEVEMLLLYVCDQRRRVKLVLRAHEIIARANEQMAQAGLPFAVHFAPEYGDFMVLCGVGDGM